VGFDTLELQGNKAKVEFHCFYPKRRDSHQGSCFTGSFSADDMVGGRLQTQDIIGTPHTFPFYKMGKSIGRPLKGSSYSQGLIKSPERSLISGAGYIMKKHPFLVTVNGIAEFTAKLYFLSF
jgi:hypothetical protein